jgi:hypothetical protein
VQLAFEHKALGNLPETVLSKSGLLKRDNTRSGLGKRRFILFVDYGKEHQALDAVFQLRDLGIVEMEPILDFSIPTDDEHQIRMYELGGDDELPCRA